MHILKFSKTLQALSREVVPCKLNRLTVGLKFILY